MERDDEFNETQNRGMSSGRKKLLLIIAAIVLTVLAAVFFTTRGGSEHQAKLMQNLNQQAQAAPPAPTQVKRDGVVIRKGEALWDSRYEVAPVTYFYLAIEIDNNGKKEVFSGFATGQRLEVPMVEVGDTVSFTTKPGEIEIIGLSIDWSKRPELSKK